jgi:hypothetical protein
MVDHWLLHESEPGRTRPFFLAGRLNLFRPVSRCATHHRSIPFRTTTSIYWICPTEAHHTVAAKEKETIQKDLPFPSAEAVVLVVGASQQVSIGLVSMTPKPFVNQ